MQLRWCNKNKLLHSVSAIWKCYNCNIKPMDLHGIYRLVKQVVTAWSTVKNLNWMVPPLPTCHRSVKRISVNFALLCLSDIMIKILEESQFTVESGSLGERLLSLAIRAAAITRGWRRRSRIFTLHSNLFGVYREAQLESKTGKDIHLLQITEVSVVYLRLWGALVVRVKILGVELVKTCAGGG